MRRSYSLLACLGAFAIALILPLLALAGIGIYKFSAAERARLEALADSANQETVLLINQEITMRGALLQALATAPSLRNGDLAAFEEQLRELARVKRLQFIMIDPSGQQIINTNMTSGVSLPRTGNRELYHEAFLTADIHVSNLFVGSITGAYLLQVSIPIRRQEKLIGTLSAILHPARLAEILREGIPGGPFYATVLDRKGVVVATTADHGEVVGKPLKALSDGCSGSKGGLSMANSEGVPIFAYCRRSSFSGWIIAAAVERDALAAPLEDSLKLLASVGFCLALFATTCAYWIGRRLTRAQGALVGAAKVIGQGQLVTSFVTPWTEANIVGNALVEASRTLGGHASALWQTNQDLEQRVISRTRELESKTSLLQTTLDTMEQGLIVISLDGRVPICSAQARKLLDLPASLMDAAPALDTVLDFQDARDEHARLSDTVRASLKPRPGDGQSVFEYERANGTILQINTVEVKRGGGFVRTVTDITKRARHEQELEEAKNAAEQASRAKGDFLATISHEMRTPLNAMIGYSDLLSQEGKLSFAVRRYAERIQGAGTALLSLIDDILDLGRIEAGVIDVRSEPFVLESLLNSALSIVRPMADAKNLRLDFELHCQPNACFLGDQDRLRQVLLNLLSNAIKFTKVGGVTLLVRQRLGEDDRHILHVAVADTGIGIAPSDQKYLFQRFHQVDPSMNRRFEGAGLGLAISKRLVEHLGGRIGMMSSFGAGSTFWFETPLRAAVAPQSDRLTSVTARSDAARSENRHILVVEDVVMNQELARELLEIAGHIVDIVDNGIEAVAAAKTGMYDLILMDLSMPEMDGLTATRLIREAGIDAQRMPIVACTANVFASREAALQDVGMNAYLRKPLRQIELYETIERVLGSPVQGEKISRSRAKMGARSDLDVVTLLGPARVVAALDVLCNDLDALSMPEAFDEPNRKRTARSAHAVISTACMLEMTELAESCRNLEVACEGGTDLALVAGQIRPLIVRSVSQARDLREELLGRIG
ncbi:ATP-binding protein [Methylobacterium marchantiae]|uniref:histidine kinase n=1 Tax=Methylobacterium marchantiae TaxID=600331 RepID=A0ABW3WZJ0_9HYPH|nr:Sensor histidine kinase RcsC [Methylobacterium marchantiae]